MNRLADVVLPIAVDKAFTYLIPPELDGAAQPGVRAIVPFGRSHAEGLIVGLPERSTVDRLKSITDIVDARPVMSDELLRLCSWVADYYMAPLGEVLKAALPHGFAKPPKRTVHALPGVTAVDVARLGRTSPMRSRILAVVLQHRSISTAELQTKVPMKTLHAALNDMARDRLLEIREAFPQRQQHTRTQSFVPLGQIDLTRLDAAAAALPPRKKRAARLLRTVRSLITAGQREISVGDLLKASTATTSSLSEFQSSGLLRVSLHDLPRAEDYGIEEQTLSITLNHDQQRAVEQLSAGILARVHKTIVLHGVTGSGKTQVYIESIRCCEGLGRSSIVLVPEIALTPQTVRRFKSHFGDRVAVVHSRMSPGERRETWRRALHGECSIVIGPRSAVFAPLIDLGLIIVDEEHEASYKQFDAMPRYNARDVAVVRGSMCNAMVVLGSATPSIESYANAKAGKFGLLELPARVDDVPMPDITIVDMAGERRRAYRTLKETLPENQRAQLKDFRQSSISQLLKEKIDDRIAKHEGIILLQNRRGFAPFMECADCGYTVMCDQCSVTMTYHLAQKHLRCHYCGLVREPLSECPQCHGVALNLVGIGTQRVEQELQALFPGARVLRMDVDTTTRKGAHGRLLEQFGSGKADILLGTQMVAKGLDFARVSLVGVISADTQMLLPDFRASERTFQLLTQVAGRAGRSSLRGEVIIQTHQPGNATLRYVTGHDVRGFCEEELVARQELLYPPFSRLVLVEARGPSEQSVRTAAEGFAASLRKAGHGVILGPAPAVISKVKDQYRWHVVVKNDKATDPGGSLLRTLLRKAASQCESRSPRNVRLIIDVDPIGLM